jgi:hypothetical protein
MLRRITAKLSVNDKISQDKTANSSRQKIRHLARKNDLNKPPLAIPFIEPGGRMTPATRWLTQF